MLKLIQKSLIYYRKVKPLSVRDPRIMMSPMQCPKYRMKTLPLHCREFSMYYLGQESQCNDTDGRNEKLATHCKTCCSTGEGNWRSLRGACASYHTRRNTSRDTGSGGGCSGVIDWVAVWHRECHNGSRWGRDSG